MLILNNVSISLQSFGTVIGVILQGPREAIEERFNSFWNWKATNAELEWLFDDMAIFYVYDSKGMPAMRKIYLAMVHATWFQRVNAGLISGDFDLPDSESYRVATERMRQANWVRLVMPNKYLEQSFSIGQVKAEKEVGDVTDIQTSALGMDSPVMNKERLEQVETSQG